MANNETVGTIADRLSRSIQEWAGELEEYTALKHKYQSDLLPNEDEVLRDLFEYYDEKMQGNLRKITKMKDDLGGQTQILNKRKFKDAPHPLLTDPDEVPDYVKEMDEKYHDPSAWFSIKEKNEATERKAQFDRKMRGGK